MTNEELITELTLIRHRQLDRNGRVLEDDHWDADMLLLRFIDDPRVSQAFREIGRWYA